MGDQSTELADLMTARKKQDFYETRDVLGTGSPEGVLAAPVGTYYTDTAGTRGAWRWLKKSGTGNTGWQVVHGDTGWRKLAAANGWAGNSYIRRVNTTVFFAVKGLSSASATSDVFATGLFGFIFKSDAELASTYALFWDILNGAPRFVSLNTPNSIDLSIVRSAYATTLGTASGNRNCSWETSQAWPTSLPGTAA